MNYYFENVLVVACPDASESVALNVRNLPHSYNPNVLFGPKSKILPHPHLGRYTNFKKLVVSLTLEAFWAVDRELYLYLGIYFYVLGKGKVRAKCVGKSEKLKLEFIFHSKIVVILWKQLLTFPSLCLWLLGSRKNRPKPPRQKKWIASSLLLAGVDMIVSLCDFGAR